MCRAFPFLAPDSFRAPLPAAADTAPACPGPGKYRRVVKATEDLSVALGLAEQERSLFGLLGAVG